MSPRKPYTVTIDDDPMVARLVEAATGMPTVAYLSVEEALRDAGRRQPVAAFLDVHLGVANGLSLIPRLREKWPTVPLLVVTSDAADRLVGEALSCGADDFLLKPLRPAEVAARMQARLRDRAEKATATRYRIGDVVLDVAHGLLESRWGRRNLAPLEVSLLRLLHEARGSVVTRESLKWGGWRRAAVSENALDRKLHSLRQALQETSRQVSIRTVYGEGCALVIERAEREDAMDRRKKTPSPLDPAKVKEIRSLNRPGEPDLLIELSDLFLADAPAVFANLEGAAKGSDPHGLASYAHKLKGMGQNLGALDLAKACAELESFGRRWEPGRDVPDLSEVRRELERLQSFLRGLKERKAA